MKLDFLPDWIYTFLIIPVAILFQRYFVASSRITVLERKDDIDDNRIEKLCNSIDSLKDEVHELIGEWKEHTRNSS